MRITESIKPRKLFRILLIDINVLIKELIEKNEGLTQEQIDGINTNSAFNQGNNIFINECFTFSINPIDPKAITIYPEMNSSITYYKTSDFTFFCVTYSKHIRVYNKLNSV